MLPAVAKRDAAEGQPRRPDRSELLQQFGQDGRGGKAAIFGAGSQLIEQPARSWCVVAAEDIWLRGNELAEAAQEVDAAFKSDQGVGIGNLQAARRVSHRETAENIGIDAKRIARIGREKSSGEH